MMLARISIVAAITQLALLAVSAFTPEPTTRPPCYVQCSDVRVIDGDTLEVDLDFPWNVTLRDQRVRCLGYDAWERSKRRRSVNVTDEEVVKGKRATSALRAWLGRGRAIYLRPGTGKARDRYGRILAAVYRQNDGGELQPAAKFMTRNGHVRE